MPAMVADGAPGSRNTIPPILSAAHGRCLVLPETPGVEMSTTRNLTIEHDGVTYGGRIATIKSTRLGYEEHGILTAYLHVEWPGGGVGVGGYCLDQPKNREARDYSRRGTAYGLDHLIRLMETVGVQTWEELSGKQVIVLFDGESAWGNQSLGIASTTDESKVFILKAHADEWLAAEVRS